MPHLNLTQKGPFDMLVSDLPVTLLHRRDIMRKRVYQYVPPAPAQRELDYQLASDVLRGDPEAWEQLYLEAYAPVMREIRRFDDRRFFRFLIMKISQTKHLRSAMSSWSVTRG